MEYKCSGCQKIVKSSSGLKRHQSTCSEYQEALDVPEIKELIPEPTDGLEATKDVEVTNDIPKEINVIAEQRKELTAKDRLSKVADAIRCCQDAQAKHFLEEEYKSLGGNLADLRK